MLNIFRNRILKMTGQFSKAHTQAGCQPKQHTQGGVGKTFFKVKYVVPLHACRIRQLLLRYLSFSP